MATKNYGVRFTKNLADQIDARGGGPWIKSQIVGILDGSTLDLESGMLRSAREPELTAEPPVPAEASPPLAAPAGAPEPQSPAGAVTTLCPRWMHHRPGVYCKACARTPR